MKNQNIIDQLYDEKPFFIPDEETKKVTITLADWLWLESFIRRIECKSEIIVRDN